MIPLIWSDTPPTEAGEFWRYRNSEGLDTVGRTFDVKCFRGLIFEFCNGDTAAVDVLANKPGAQWAGPIPEPEEGCKK